jgi:uncharacterized membrane protein
MLVTTFCSNLASFVCTVGRLLGPAMLFKAGLDWSAFWSGRILVGVMLADWGPFDLIEGIVDHHVLSIHHVLPGHPQQLLWDLLFLGSGVLLCIGGYMLAKTRGSAPAASAAQTPATA